MEQLNDLFATDVKSVSLFYTTRKFPKNVLDILPYSGFTMSIIIMNLKRMLHTFPQTSFSTNIC